MKRLRLTKRFRYQQRTESELRLGAELPKGTITANLNKDGNIKLTFDGELNKACHCLFYKALEDTFTCREERDGEGRLLIWALSRFCHISSRGEGKCPDCERPQVLKGSWFHTLPKELRPGCHGGSEDWAGSNYGRYARTRSFQGDPLNWSMRRRGLIAHSLN